MTAVGAAGGAGESTQDASARVRISPNSMRAAVLLMGALYTKNRLYAP